MRIITAFSCAAFIAVAVVKSMPMQDTPDEPDQGTLQMPDDQQQEQPNVLLQQQQRPPGPEPQPGEALEDEPRTPSAASVFMEDDQMQQRPPGPEPQPGEVLEDEPPASSAASVLLEDQCVRCPRFRTRCRCRFFEDCRFIRGTCFTCPRWRCRVRERGGFPGFPGRGGGFPGRGFPGRGFPEFPGRGGGFPEFPGRGRPIDFAGPVRR